MLFNLNHFVANLVQIWVCYKMPGLKRRLAFILLLDFSFQLRLKYFIYGFHNVTATLCFGSCRFPVTISYHKDWPFCLEFNTPGKFFVNVLVHSWLGWTNIFRHNQDVEAVCSSERNIPTVNWNDWGRWKRKKWTIISDILTRAIKVLWHQYQRQFDHVVLI